MHDFIVLAAKGRDSADFGHAENVGAGRSEVLWQLRHNTGLVGCAAS
jgi:hypothetical protein